MDNIIAEMKEVRDKYGTIDFTFWDETFTVNRKRILEFCEKVKPMKVGWRCDTRIDVYPKTDLDAGEYINVEIFPGSKCVDRRAYIYYAAGTGAKATVQPSGTSKQKLCDPYTLTYKTQAVWGENPGVYYVKVFDFGTKDFVKDVFVIRGEE